MKVCDVMEKSFKDINVRLKISSKYFQQITLGSDFWKLKSLNVVKLLLLQIIFSKTFFIKMFLNFFVKQIIPFFLLVAPKQFFLMDC